MNIKSSAFLTLLLLAFSFNTEAQQNIKTVPAGTTSTAQAANDDTEIQDNVADADQSEAPVQEIKIDEDELPEESVTPKTDNSSSVLNKQVKFNKRFLIDVQTGSILDEPLVNSNYFLGRATYYTTEEMAFGLGFKSRFGGKTSYSEQLNAGTAQLEFERAPSPTASHFLSFGYNFYYGKISMSKNMIIPASTKFECDAGMQKVGSATLPFVQSSLNQSFYLSKHLALGLSIGLSIAKTYDSTSVNIRSSQPVPNESDFSDKIQFNQFLAGSLSILL